MIHPKDKNSSNPRLQCSVCRRWMRLHGVKVIDGIVETFQRFYGGCDFTNGGDHLAGDMVDVCDNCCQKECKALSIAPTINNKK